MNFEEAFDRAEKAAQAAARAAARLAAAARALTRAAAEGDIGRLRKAGERLNEEADTARQEAVNACSAWPFNPETEERYLREEYVEELLRTAGANGLKMQRHDEAIMVYPLVVRVLPGQRVVTLNRNRATALRPSKLVARLKAIQNRKLRGNPQAFLEALFSAYKLIAGGEREGVAVPLMEVFRILTLLPGADYSKEEFARDLLNLDRTGMTATKSGVRISFPASTGTRDARNTFVCVAPEGEIISFFAVKFTEETP